MGRKSLMISCYFIVTSHLCADYCNQALCFSLCEKQWENASQRLSWTESQLWLNARLRISFNYLRDSKQTSKADPTRPKPGQTRIILATTG